MPQPFKRAKIEAKLGQSLESFLKKKLAEGLTPNGIAPEIELDPATIRYYIKKFEIPYQPKRQAPRSRISHLSICLCPRCDVLPVRCVETRQSHKLRRCICACVNFKKRGKI